MRNEPELRNLPKFNIIRPGQKCLRRPFSQFAAVIFQLRRQNGATLGVDLRSPFDSAAILTKIFQLIIILGKKSYCLTRESHSLNALIVKNCVSPLGPVVTPSCSHRHINTNPLPKSHLRYLSG